MSAITERARAKINLTLRVHGRRADGYHLLESLIAFAGVGDGLTFEPGGARTIEMSGPYASGIAGSNLVDTALQSLAAADPILTLGRVTVDKHLPIAAGMGGGSADAAAVLRAVRRINPANGVDWERLAAALGADVSVCLADRSSLVWGVGEHVEPVDALPRLDAVLVCPQTAAPFGKTKAVFAQLSVLKSEVEMPPAPLPPFPDTAALIDYMRGVGNDLRSAAHAVLPDSAEAEAAVSAQPDCLYVSLSGAGPTSYGIFPNAARAAAAAEQLRAQHPGWWIAATTLGD
jgi:4-diphosphocytidyl-2-C-methyl-D-erythritol kinase